MDEAELFNDEPDDEFCWGPAEKIAAFLGISDRTLRTRAVRNEGVEKKRVGGRVYYRCIAGYDGDQDGSGGSGASTEMEVNELRRQLIEAHQQNAFTVEQLRERLLDEARARSEAEKRAETAELLADVATRDMERAAGERDAARALAASERQRRKLLERAAALPWWAIRRRRVLLEQVVGLDMNTELLLLPATVSTAD